MASLWATAATAVDAVIVGDVAAAQGALTWLADNSPVPEEMPASLAPFASQVRQHAAEGGSAEGIAQVASAIGSMAVACGGCHAAAETGPITEVAPLPEGTETGDHMARHRWALDSLWEGVVVPDDDRWRAGALAFVEVPVVADATGHEGSMAWGGEAEGWADGVHALGRTGLQLPPGDERGVLFGQLLGLCASCHRATGGGPE